MWIPRELHNHTDFGLKLFRVPTSSMVIPSFFVLVNALDPILRVPQPIYSKSSQLLRRVNHVFPPQGLTGCTSKTRRELNFLDLRPTLNHSRFTSHRESTSLSNKPPEHLQLDQLILNYASRKVHTLRRCNSTQGALPVPVGLIFKKMECGDADFCFSMAKTVPSGRMSFILRQNEGSGSWSLIELEKNGITSSLLNLSLDLNGSLRTIALDDITGLFIFVTSAKPFVVYC
ncbi:hypothetical protein B0H13DRAFT_1904661 [Mycena leptocephala]|nr:hypothetical protein B0H13DRAFT_1904661 [Mycena leptocephala]